MDLNAQLNFCNNALPKFILNATSNMMSDIFEAAIVQCLLYLGKLFLLYMKTYKVNTKKIDIKKSMVV